MKKYIIILSLFGLTWGQTYSAGDSIPNFTLPVCANGNGQDSISLYDYYGMYPCDTEYFTITLIWMYSWESQTMNYEYLSQFQTLHEEDNGTIVLGIGGDFGQPYNCEEYPSTFGVTFPILDDTDFNIYSWFGDGYAPFHCTINYDMTLSENALSGLALPSPYVQPYVFQMDDMTISEDETYTAIIEIENGVDSYDFFISSSNLNVLVSVTDHNSNELAVLIEPIDNWSGVSEINVGYTDLNCSITDIMSFLLFVNEVNDPPENFALVYPTINDTIQVSLDSDETIMFNWEESIDIDSDVSYNTTITLDYFGNNFSQSYESNEPYVFIVTYDWAVLMTNENISRWTMEYVIEATDGENIIESEIGQFVFENTSLSIDSEVIPFSFQLHQNYPNPFNPVTTFQYDLPEDGLVNITVYDLLGNVINNLVDSNQSSGFKSVQWNATNNQGQPVSAGVYLYTIEAGEFRQTKKMILLK